MHDRIIEKAEKLGIKTTSPNSLEKLEEIALQLGLADFDPQGDLSYLEDLIDSELKNSDTDDNIELLDENNYVETLDNDSQSLEFEEPKINAIPDENEDYDKNKEKEHNENINNADEEKKDNPKDTKSQGDKEDSDNLNNDNTKKDYSSKDSNTSRKEDDSTKNNIIDKDEKTKKDDNINNEKNTNEKNNAKNQNINANKFKDKNTFDKAKNNANLLKSKTDSFKNKIGGLKSKANQIAHPGEALKNKAKSSAKNTAKKAGKAAVKAVGKAAKAAGKALVAFIKSNPYALLIIGIILVVIFLLFLIVSISDSDTGTGGGVYFDQKCNFNNTKVVYNFCNSSESIEVDLDDFVVGVTFDLLKDKEYDNEDLKALIIAVKTKVLSIGNYNNDSQKISIDGCSIGYTRPDIIEKITYEIINSATIEVSRYLYLAESYVGTITSLTQDNDLEINVDDFIQDGTYEEILKKVYVNENLILYDMSSQCDIYLYNTSNLAYWWPIGSANETVSNIYGGTPTTIRVSSKFGMRVHPITKKNKLHGGIDIAASCGEVIIATRSGKVTDVKNGCVDARNIENAEEKNVKQNCGFGWGNYVKVSHGDGTVSIYAHAQINSIIVKKGDNVLQGQKLALVGSTGMSTGCHLHFEIRNNGTRVDPLGFIDSDNPRLIK